MPITRRSLLNSAAVTSMTFALNETKAFARVPRSPRDIILCWRTISDTPTCPVAARPPWTLRTSTGSLLEGVRFLQAYANSAVCSATRTALITGR